jgi:NDP-sugar pyrophosphorylase family protein
MVLAAGRGERMRPLSDVLPKPALPLIDEPVIASALRLASATGANRTAVNAWHLADAMERAVATVNFETEIVVSRETRLMDTAGGIALARDRDLLGDRGPVLVVNGDGLFDLDPEPLLQRMSGHDDLVSLALMPHPDPRSWSRVALDPSGSVRSIRKPGRPERGERPLLYPGVMLVSREALSRLVARPGAVPERLWGPALAEGRLGGVEVAGRWREIGSPPEYLGAALDLLGGKCAVHPSAEIHPSATVDSALIGCGAKIEADAVVNSSVVAEGATIARGARILRSVVLGSVRAGDDEDVVDRFLTPNS